MTAEKTVDLKPIVLSTIDVELVGETPLIVHRFGEKMRTQIRDKQQGKTQEAKKKSIRKPDEEYESAKYYFTDPETGEM